MFPIKEGQSNILGSLYAPSKQCIVCISFKASYCSYHWLSVFAQLRGN